MCRAVRRGSTAVVQVVKGGKRFGGGSAVAEATTPNATTSTVSEDESYLRKAGVGK
jgi:hypothetical protein